MVDHTVLSDVVLTTYGMGPFFIIICILIVIFIILVLRGMIKNKMMRLLNLRFYAKVIFILTLLILFLVLFIYKILIFEITMGAEGASLVFVLINALLFNIFIAVCFSGLVKNKNAFLKIAIFILVIYIAVSGLGDLGFRFVLNIEAYVPGFLAHKRFEFNTAEGVRFMFLNMGIFIIIFSASLLLEHKQR